MTTGEAAYLVLVIAAMLAFSVTLAWVSRRDKQAGRKRRSSPVALPHGGTSAAPHGR